MPIMGWNVHFLLHLFCAMAAMAGVHSQDNATEEVIIHNQAFEGEAVHSMMQSWIEAGTSRDLFKSSGWFFEKHSCDKNWSQITQYNVWLGIVCSTRFFQHEDSKLEQYHTLVRLHLYNNDYVSMPLVGELPPAIVNLTNLETLVILDQSKLSGPLPVGLFCSQILQIVILHNCSFNGSIRSGLEPDCDINEWLQYLDLSRNSFIEMSPISKHNSYSYLRHL